MVCIFLQIDEVGKRRERGDRRSSIGRKASTLKDDICQPPVCLDVEFHAATRLSVDSTVADDILHLEHSASHNYFALLKLVSDDRRHKEKKLMYYYIPSVNNLLSGGECTWNMAGNEICRIPSAFASILHQCVIHLFSCKLMQCTGQSISESADDGEHNTK